MKFATYFYTFTRMKRLLLALMLLVSIATLAGCAGVQSNFECDANAGDSCMTMEEANTKAREMVNPSAGKQVAIALPTLVKPPYGMKAKGVLINPPAASVIKPERFLKPTSVKAASIVFGAVPTSMLTAEHCTSRRCDDAGQIRAKRTPEATTSLWIAPYVDTKDVLHQPGRVSFVVTDSRWQPLAMME